MSVTLHESAYAKLNLTLDVLDRRPDGYHNIRSVMQTISIRDDIQLEVGTGQPWQLTCDKGDIPQDGGNLAWQAAEVFYRAVKGIPAACALPSPSASRPRPVWGAGAPTPPPCCGH